MAKSYFEEQEYQRVSFFSSSCTHPINVFLHDYAIYLDGELKKLDDEVSLLCNFIILKKPN